MDKKNREKIVNYLTIFFILLTLILLILHYKESVKSAAQLNQLKLNLQTLQVAFESYYQEHSTYPQNIKNIDSLKNIFSHYIKNVEGLNFKIVKYEVTEKGYKLRIRINNKIFELTPEGIILHKN